MQGSGRLILSMPNPIEHCTASQTKRKPSPALGRNPLIPPPTSHVACCVSPLDRRKPEERGRRFPIGRQSILPWLERDES